LRCVCLDKNPIENLESYRQHVLAYLDQLKYLDYTLIDPTEVQAAQQDYQHDELQELKDGEAAAKNRALEQEKKEAELKQLRKAFMDCTADLFQQLFSKEVEPENVTVLACYPGHKEDYKDKLNGHIKDLQHRLEPVNDKRLRKVASFEKAVFRAEQESEGEAKVLVKQFRSVKKIIFGKLDEIQQSVKRMEDGQAGPDYRDRMRELRSEAERLRAELLRDLEQLETHLMSNEIQLQLALDEAITDFDIQMGDTTKFMLEGADQFFRHLEMLEKNFSAAVAEGAQSEMEQFGASGSAVDLTDFDAKKAAFLSNREEMMTAIQNFFEAHTNLITSKDDSMQAEVKQWKNTFFNDHRERQYKRNRERIHEIKELVEEARTEIKESKVGFTGDSDDEEGNGD